MEERTTMERKIFICICHGLEHQLAIRVDEYDGFIYVEPHLTTHRNFFSRLIYGLKYAFGYKSRYGAWDEIIIGPEDQLKLRQILDQGINISEKKIEKPFDQQHGGY
jgi:hypothetical protein